MHGVEHPVTIGECGKYSSYHAPDGRQLRVTTGHGARKDVLLSLRKSMSHPLKKMSSFETKSAEF